MKNLRTQKKRHSLIHAKRVGGLKQTNAKIWKMHKYVYFPGWGPLSPQKNKTVCEDSNDEQNKTCTLICSCLRACTHV